MTTRDFRRWRTTTDEAWGNIGRPTPQTADGPGEASSCGARRSALEYAAYSYGVNFLAVFGSPGTWGNPALTVSRNYYKIPQSTFITADASSAWILPPARWTLTLDTDSDTILDSNAVYYSDPTQLQYNGFAPRHGKRGNFLYRDGSVRPTLLKSYLKNEEKIWGTLTRP